LHFFYEPAKPTLKLTNKTAALLCFKPKYGALFLVLFATEVYIAKYISDAIVRPFIGDVLVIVLIYCFFKLFLNTSSAKIALGVFVFACFIELLQAIHFVKLLGLQSCKPIAIALGSTFDAKDILAYAIGYSICRLPFFRY